MRPSTLYRNVESEKISGVWLFSRRIDLIGLFAPVVACWCIAFLLPEDVRAREYPLWIWVVIILGIDVSHVWTTIFRTYLDKEEFALHRTLLIGAPLLAFGIMLAVAEVSHLLFWRLLAYAALIHFVKQQYGFAALYAMKFATRYPQAKALHNRRLDKCAVYFAAGYPVLFWHLNYDRHFTWFVENDFVRLNDVIAAVAHIDLAQVLAYMNPILNASYWIVISAYVGQQIFIHLKAGVPAPQAKLFWILATAVNWYLGIVFFNSDLVFTLTNVVAHGAPYIVLIYFYADKKPIVARQSRGAPFVSFKRAWRFALFSTIALSLAFFEEYWWDLLMYRERGAFFETVLAYPFGALQNVHWQSFALAVLALPQATHYVIDAYIWKNNAKNPYLKKIIAG